MRLNVTDLVGQPGATRAVRDVVGREEFGDAPWGAADEVLGESVTLDLHLDSVVEGILVRGSIGFEVTMACGRCLSPQQAVVDADVTELFLDPERAEEEVEVGYELVDDLTGLDLSTLVRDALLVDLPIRVLCRDDCAGLCVTCGADRNTETCGHSPTEDVDPRWAALADVTLPPE